MNTYDFCVIGGGPAGSTISTLLARKGYQILLLEKEKFPREHVGESMLPVTYTLLKELGVYDEMTTRFYRKPGVAFTNHDGSQSSTWCFNRLINDEGFLSFHVQRSKFDNLLLRNAQKSGVEVIEEIRVEKVDFLEGEPTRVRTEKGDFFCRFLIDASGQDTFLGRQLNTKEVYSESGIRNAFFAHWKNPDMDEHLKEGVLKIVYLGEEKNGWMWMIPIEEEKISIGIVLDVGYIKNYRKQQKESGQEWNAQKWEEALYRKVISETPLARMVTQNATIANKVNSKGNYSYIVDQKFNDRYAMVGDSAAFIDPIFASGIYLAMKSASIIAEGLDQFHQSGQLLPLEKAYQRIDGAYDIIKRLINLYYDKDSIHFNELNPDADSDAKKHETAIHIFHLLISGNFFEESDKYLKTIDVLTNYDKYLGFKNLSGYSKQKPITDSCL